MLNCHKIVKNYVSDKDLEYQRVFLARSDPALNYGMISAVLINKIACKRLDEVEKETDINIYPILGVGSAPFRGNLIPETVRKSLKEYPSVQTYTIQSAFKYDQPEEDVKEAIEYIRSKKKSRAQNIDVKRCLEIIEKVSENYRKKVEKLADDINEISKFIPSRRSRKLHVGLFGYSRELNGSKNETKLPRAIKFTASLYSLGIPPEIIGISSLEERDLEFLENVYKKISLDMKNALQYLNENSLNKFDFLKEDAKLAKDHFQYKSDPEHIKCTNKIINSDYSVEIRNEITKAAKIRKFLG